MSTASATDPRAPQSKHASKSVRRIAAIRWLRKAHGWIGLWGAALGLLFGVSGIVMNHRAMLKIPVAQTQESQVQLPLPQPAPTDARALAEWLRTQMPLATAAPRIREEPAHGVAWGDQALQQPAHWTLNFASPRSSVQADYWVGNQFVSVKRSDGNLFAMFNNLHKGVGLGLGWILLVDTLGGSIILLSLTGVVLWTQLNRRRLIGATIASTSLGLLLLLALQVV